MKTITAPNGKQYEVDEGWREFDGTPSCVDKQILYDEGTVMTYRGTCARWMGANAIAWRPIVPPKEVRWRAEMGCVYWFVDDDGETETDYDTRHVSDELRYRIGNYFRTREEAEASNKAKVMRDPESER